MLSTLSGITQDITGLDPFTADVVLLSAGVTLIALTTFFFSVYLILSALRDKRNDPRR